MKKFAYVIISGEMSLLKLQCKVTLHPILHSSQHSSYFVGAVVTKVIFYIAVYFACEVSALYTLTPSDSIY
jgi:hypothetical protein